MSKITIKFKNPSFENQINIYPKIKITSLLKSNRKPFKGFEAGVLNETYRSNYESNNSGNRFIVLGVEKNYEGTLHLGNPESLNLVPEDHNHYISEILPAPSGDTLLGIIDTKVPVDPSTKKIAESNLPGYVKGQMRYVGSVSLNLEGEPTAIPNIFDALEPWFDTESPTSIGAFIITTTDGFMKFDGENKPYVNYGNEMYTEEVIYLSAGSMIVFVERKNNINYYALIRRDVKSSAIDRYGMLKLSNLLHTYPNPKRENLSNAKTSENIITEQILSKLGFDITKNDTELIFESFESLD